MYYVKANLDIIEQFRIIKEEQQALFDKMCCKQRRRKDNA